MQLFQERLRLARKARHLSQEEAARRLNISYRSYRRYETGEAEPGVFTAAAIADLYDTSLDYLTGRTDDPAPRR